MLGRGWGEGVGAWVRGGGARFWGGKKHSLKSENGKGKEKELKTNI